MRQHHQYVNPHFYNYCQDQYTNTLLNIYNFGITLKNNHSKTEYTANKNIVNLSSFQLTSDHIAVLDKGLTFVPTNNYYSLNALTKDKDNFIRSIKLKDFFSNKNPTNENPKSKKFRKPSTWIPMDKDLSKKH